MLIPKTLRDSNFDCQKLEFDLNLYFTFYPVNTSLGKPIDQDKFKTELKNFGKFLKRNGQIFADKSEFSHYYLLPFMKNPYTNPLFAQQISKEYPSEIKKSLIKFLSISLPETGKPRIYEKLEDQSEEKQDQYTELLKQYTLVLEEKENARIKLLESQAKWTDLAKDILSISKDLLMAVQAITSSPNKKINKDFLKMSEEQLGKYEAFLNANKELFPTKENLKSVIATPIIILENEIEERKILQKSTNPAPTITPPSANSVPIVNITPPPPPVSNPELLPSQALPVKIISSQPEIKQNVAKPIETNENINLDYEKMKIFMKESNDDKKLLELLVALRLRVTTEIEFGLRQNIIIEYINSDIFDCRNSCETLERLLSHLNEKIVQETLKLLMVFSSGKLGTHYLTEKTKPIEILVELLMCAVFFAMGFY